MKTLDEVVKSYEISIRNNDCDKCPYDNECYDHHVCECYERMEDTYHYLKEYQERLQNLQDMMDRYDISVKNYEEAVENCRIAEQKYWRMTNNVEDMNLFTWDELKHQEIVCPKCHSVFVILPDANNPLTWDELKAMEGKPVWVESHGNITEFTGWAIVRNALEDRVHFIFSHYDGEFLTYEMALPDVTFGKEWQAFRKEKS